MVKLISERSNYVRSAARFKKTKQDVIACFIDYEMREHGK